MTTTFPHSVPTQLQLDHCFAEYILPTQHGSAVRTSVGPSPYRNAIAACVCVCVCSPVVGPGAHASHTCSTRLMMGKLALAVAAQSAVDAVGRRIWRTRPGQMSDLPSGKHGVFGAGACLQCRAVRLTFGNRANYSITLWGIMVPGIGFLM